MELHFPCSLCSLVVLWLFSRTPWVDCKLENTESQKNWLKYKACRYVFGDAPVCVLFWAWLAVALLINLSAEHSTVPKEHQWRKTIMRMPTRSEPKRDSNVEKEMKGWASERISMSYGMCAWINSREWSLVQWLQVLILCGEDVGSNPAGKLFTPQKLSIHIPNPSLPPSLRRRRGRVPSEILQTFP